jgi:DNA (cytosine-5)-methyltransferase 1
MLKLLDLFSGIGGFSLGLESTGGFKTIGFVEKDKFCQKVLKKHWSNINIEEDIRNVKGEKYAADIITGGFPCQPFSVAGKRKSTADDRYLWDEMLRVIREVKPRWVIGENVEGLININNGMVLRQVQTDLEEQGFQVQCIVIPASGIGAWHQRKRIWIVANSNCSRSLKEYNTSVNRQDKRNGSINESSSRSNKNVPNSNARLSTRENQEIQTGGNTTINGSQDVSNSDSIRHGGWSSEECKNGEWSFLQGKQKRGKMGSEVERCNGDVSNSESISSNDGRYGNNSKEKQIQLKARRKDSDGYVSNSDSERLEGHRNKQQLQKDGREKHSIGNSNDETKESWWQTQSRICGVPNGVSFELDKDRSNRIKALGNSIVPQIVREIGLTILESEKL